MKKIAIIAALTAFSGFAVASDDNLFEQHKENIYVGAGLGSYSLDYWDNGVGYQVFAGYNLDFELSTGTEFLDKLAFAVEAGYTSSSYKYYSAELDVAGLWGAAVASYPINENFKVGATLGLDLGDDSGLLFGFNSTYKINEQFDIRTDYVIRDLTDGLTINVIYKF